MGNLKLQGTQGIFAKPVEIQHAKLKPDLKLSEIKAATENNDLDEVVVRNGKGETYIAFADELHVENGTLPKPGDIVKLDFVEGELEVLHVDNELNEDWYTGPLVPILSGKPLTGDSTGINTLKEKL